MTIDADMVDIGVVGIIVSIPDRKSVAFSSFRRQGTQYSFIYLGIFNAIGWMSEDVVKRNVLTAQIAGATQQHFTQRARRFEVIWESSQGLLIVRRMGSRIKSNCRNWCVALIGAVEGFQATGWR